MINIRKIVLLSVMLMSASSITAPTYAMDGDERGVVQASRVTHARMPWQLTRDMLQDIRQYGSFFANIRKESGSFSGEYIKKEYVLQNPDQLDMFENCLNPSYSSFSFDHSQSCFMDHSGLRYYILESGISRKLNPDYDPMRSEETGPEWIGGGHGMEISRLIFKEQDPAPAKPLAVAPKVEEQEIGSVVASSMQPSSSVDPSPKVDTRAMIRSLTETYKSDPEGLTNALVDFCEKALSLVKSK